PSATGRAKDGKSSDAVVPPASEVAVAVAPDVIVQTAAEFAILAETVAVPEGEAEPAEGTETTSARTPPATSAAEKPTEDSGETEVVMAQTVTVDVPAPVAAPVPT